MNRAIVAAVGISALIAASAFVWLDARREREYRRLLAAGDTALARGQTFEAIEVFSGALALKSSSMIARLKRGDTYRRRGEFGSAVRDLSEAAAMDPTAPRPLELLGDSRAAMGQYEAAAADYERCLRLDDRAPRVVYKLGLARYQSGAVKEAVETLRRAIALEDGLAPAHYLLGLALRDQGTMPAAEREWRRAVELDPTLAAAREELAAFYLTSGRTRLAFEQLEALAALEPARPERLVRVGLAYARLGRHDAAVLTLSRALERHPDAGVVYTALGRVWLEAAEQQEDRVALRKALDALARVADEPSATSEALALYGRALYLSGSGNAAERTLRRATARYPVHPLAFTYLAQTARRLGHADIARDAETRRAALTGG